MPTCTLKHIDDNGRTIATLSDVLAPVALTGVETSSGSNLVTVASTAGLHSGMAIHCPNLPPNCIIHAVKSSTVLEVWASIYASGAWTTTAANANATASLTGMLARALGFCPNTIVAKAYAEGTWRNTIRAPGFFGSSFQAAANLPYTNVPQYTVSGGSLTLVTPLTAYLSDELSASPVKRDNGERWGFHIITHTNGFQSKIVARPKHDIIVSAITA